VVYVKDSDLLSPKFTDDELVLAMKLEFKNWMGHVNKLNCVLLILGVSLNSTFVSNASHQVIEIEINPPDQMTRLAIIKYHLSNILYEVSDDELEMLSFTTAGFSDTSLEEVVQESLSNVLTMLMSGENENINSPVLYKHLENTVIKMKLRDIDNEAQI